MTVGASPFWLIQEPLILASASAGRQLVLRQAGLPFEARPADVDERAIEASLGVADADVIAGALARAKALAVSRHVDGRWVIGADQVASCEQRIFGKPPTREKAAELLRFSPGVDIVCIAPSRWRDPARWCSKRWRTPISKCAY